MRKHIALEQSASEKREYFIRDLLKVSARPLQTSSGKWKYSADAPNQKAQRARPQKSEVSNKRAIEG
jgi:hypothetical protein